MPTITRHKPISIYTNAAFTASQFNPMKDAWLGLKIVGIVVATLSLVIAVVMGVGVYKQHIGLGTEIGENRMLWRTGSGEQSARPIPVDETVDITPVRSNPVIWCQEGKC